MHSPENAVFLVGLPIRASRDMHTEIADRFADAAGVQKAPKQAVSDTIRDHARSGHKIVVWRDNEVF